MKHFTSKPLTMTLAAFALAPMLAAAQVGAQQSGGANYACGGVSDSGQQEIKAAARQYDLMLTFAVNTGQYLADVDVQIRDRRGNAVVEARCDGPIMLVDLPAAGRYTVLARYDGTERRRTVNVTGKGGPTRAVMIWPANGNM